MTLHEAIELILQNARTPMTSREIADKINTDELYMRKDGLPVSASQVSTRTNNYNKIFTKEFGKIKLVKEDVKYVKKVGN